MDDDFRGDDISQSFSFVLPLRMRPGAITTPEPLLAPVRFAHGQKISGFAVETSSLTTAFSGLFSSAGAS